MSWRLVQGIPCPPWDWLQQQPMRHHKRGKAVTENGWMEDLFLNVDKCFFVPNVDKCFFVPNVDKCFFVPKRISSHHRIKYLT